LKLEEAGTVVPWHTLPLDISHQTDVRAGWGQRGRAYNRPAAKCANGPKMWKGRCNSNRDKLTTTFLQIIKQGLRREREKAAKALEGSGVES